MRTLALCVLAIGLLAGCAQKTSVTPKTVVDEKVKEAERLNARIAAGMESLRQRDPERARRHLSRALEMAPRSPEAHNAMALLYNYEGDKKREEEHYLLALRHNPGFSQARNNYATLLYRQGRYKEAIEQLRRATDDTSYDQRSIAFLNLGRSYLQVGEVANAAAAMERSLRLDTNQPDAYLELADAQFQLGKLADARFYHQGHVSRVARQSPRSLWLGIRIEHALGGADRVASYEMALDSLFRGTPEHQAWQAWKRGLPAAGGKP